MKCTLCGVEFTKETAARACQNCFLHTNCRLIKCPNCGYEFPEEPSWLNRILKGRKAQPGQSDVSKNSGQSLQAKAVTGTLGAAGPVGPAGATESSHPALSASADIPLAKLERGYRAFISAIQTQDRTTLKKLMALGFLPGCEVRVRQSFPAYVVELGNSQYAIDKYIAEQILVQKMG